MAVALSSTRVSMSSNSSDSSSGGSSPYQWTPDGALPDPNRSEGVSLFAWIVVALLFPVALLNYLDRQMLASMKASMVSSIPSIQDKEQWGLVLASFKWVYAVLSPFGGYVADRFSRRWVIGLSLLIWSAVTWMTAYVTTFDQLLWARAAMGISEAFYIPAALALITDFHQGSTRSRAVSIHQAGIYCGLIIGGQAGFVAESPTLGWQWAFKACGVVGVIYSLPLLALLRNPPRSNSTESVSPGSAIVQLATNWNFLLLVAYFTLPAIAGWVVKDWMPEILREKFSLGQGKGGLIATVVHPASILGAVIGGYLADRWMRKSDRGRIFVSAIGMTLFLPALFSVGLAETAFIAIVGLVLFGFGWGFFDCNNMPILCQIVRPELRATGYGLMNLVSISCGGFADWGFGFLRDRGVSLPVIFGAFALIAALSVVIVLCIRPAKLDHPS
jgi:MFS transporter, Spinster family, sphingosine-1-phosphate transporter